MSAARNLRLEVVLKAIDKFTAPFKGVLNQSKAVAKQVSELKNKMKELDKTQGHIDSFKKLARDAAQTSLQMKAAQERATALGRSLAATADPTKKMSAEFNRAKKEAAELAAKHTQLVSRQQSLRTSLNAAGVSTRNLSQHQRELRQNATSTTAALQREQQQLERLGRQSQRLHAAKASYEKSISFRDKMAGAGASSLAAGAAISLPVMQTVKEARHFDTEKQRVAGLGFSKETNRNAELFARAMKTYGTSATENMTLVRDAMTVFADLEHAEMVAPTLSKMKFANTAIYGEADGAKNEEQFMTMLKVIELRGGLKSHEAFIGEANRIQQVISATGGKVGPDEWKNFIQTGGVAAKQLKSNAFYNQMEPLIQEMGGHQVGTGLMSAYSNVYQGKTTVRAAREMERLGLINPDKVEYDKVGQLKRIKPGALKNGEGFKTSPLEWLENTLLPALKANGITSQSAINDSISSIFTNQTAAKLMATMVMQMEQIHKSAKLSEGSANIDQLNELAKISTKGKEVAARKRKDDLELAIGENILPLYNQILEKILSILNGTKKWMDKNKELSKAIEIVAGTVGLFLLAIGTLALSASAILGPLALLKLSMRTLNIQLGLGTILANAAKFSFGLLTGALGFVSKAVMFLGRAMLMNPIGLIIMGIAIAAFLIYKYWEPIKEFFTNLWAQIKESFNSGILSIVAVVLNWSPLGLFYRAFAAVLSWFGIDLPETFTGFGIMWVEGLWKGISSAWGWMQGKIAALIKMLPQSMQIDMGVSTDKAPIDIINKGKSHVPKGQNMAPFTGQSVEQAKLLDIMKQMNSGVIGSADLTAMSNIPIDKTPPLFASPSAYPTGPATPININVHPAPGMNEQALAKLVAQEIAKAERQKQVRSRSRLGDSD